jgi:hypothetical protein
MEHRLGSDFSGVRIHRGAEAAESAQSIDARAYTSGNDIVFNSGEYQPQTSSGQRLLAHELVHTLQQTGGVQRKDQPAPSSVVKDLRDLLENDSYRPACLKLSEVVPWDDESAKKKWLAGQPTIRLLFLRGCPDIDRRSRRSGLMILARRIPIIDCWYQRGAKRRLRREPAIVRSFPQTAPVGGAGSCRDLTLLRRTDRGSHSSSPARQQVRTAISSEAQVP